MMNFDGDPGILLVLTNIILSIKAGKFEQLMSHRARDKQLPQFCSWRSALWGVHSCYRGISTRIQHQFEHIFYVERYKNDQMVVNDVLVG